MSKNPILAAILADANLDPAFQAAIDAQQDADTAAELAERQAAKDQLAADEYAFLVRAGVERP